MRPVDLFHIGPQKTATTWVYSCFREHPEVCCPEKDTIHYYDMYYSKGADWYSSHFSPSSHQITFDPTYTYIRSPLAAQRMHTDNPNARILVCLRDPAERAFSHYWHEKKKGTISFDFEDVFSNYDLFSSWVETGFYATHLKRFLTYYDRSQLCVLWFETLQDNPEGVYNDICTFAQIDSRIRPECLTKKVNKAGTRLLGGTAFSRVGHTLKECGILPTGARRRARDMHRVVSNMLYPEYKNGMKASSRKRLQELCELEIQETEKLLGVNLDSWRA